LSIDGRISATRQKQAWSASLSGLIHYAIRNEIAFTQTLDGGWHGRNGARKRKKSA
jgi:hypothetical protein